MKRRIKILIDVVMTGLFLVLMAYHITSNALHEWLGTGLFVLFIVHHLLNLNWHRTLLKGRYTPARIMMLALDLLLFTAMLGMMVSGILLSREVFGFLHLRAGMFGRRLHMVSTAWGYVLMAAHLGLHWGQVVAAAKKKIHVPAVVPKAVAAVLAVYGAYAFYVRGLWKYLFLLVEYAFFDYEEPALLFFADYLAILALFAAAAYYTSKRFRTAPRKETP